MFKGAIKEDLRLVAFEIGVELTDKMTVLELNTAIKNSDPYKSDPDSVNEIANMIIERRKSEESKQLELEKIKLERSKAELELVKIRAEIKSDIPKIESNNESLDTLIKSVRTLTMKIPTIPEGWGFFFSSLERAFVSKEIPEKYKAEILLNLLGDKASNIITYIEDKDLINYTKVKEIVLREFQPTPYSCLEQFRKASRLQNETHVQFASRLTTCWNYYLKLRDVKDFESLNQLIISDKIYQTLDKETATHISVRQGDKWFKPSELGKEVDLFFTSKGKSFAVSSNTYKSASKNVSKVFLSDISSNFVLCKTEYHHLSKCPNYLKLSVNDRVEVVKNNHLCFNCMSNKHSVLNCSSKMSCFCKKRHHKTLHFPNRNSNENRNACRKNDIAIKSESALQSSRPSTTAVYEDSKFPNVQAPEFVQSLTFMSNHSNKKKNKVLLSTAICILTDANGKEYKLRCLLDGGSESCLLSKQIVDIMQLKKEKVDIVVCGLNDSSLRIKTRVNANIRNENKSYVKNVDFLVVPKITTDFIPSQRLNISLENFRHIKLADDKFKIPQRIDCLLGAEVYLELLQPGQIRFDNSNIILQNSVFGFFASGSYVTEKESGIHCGMITEETNLDNTLKQFWELENVEVAKKGSKESEFCEKHFKNNYTREDNGKYVVKMPFKEDPTCLGNSKQIALKRLNSLWIRLNKDENYLLLYSHFLREYRDLGHMTEVKNKDDEQKGTYYIPHLGIYRPEKSSTPLRVVFDASTTTSKGNSLNSIQCNGGVIQEDLFSIMVRFRKHIFAFTADIKKMYRMISIHPTQRQLQRILWKESINGPVKAFELNTVTYGTVSAPFLAMRTLPQLAIDEFRNFPLAAAVLQSDFYMDDVLTGSSSLSAAKELQQELIEILRRATMSLHKWCSNNPELAVNVDDEYTFQCANEVSALGVSWKADKDCFNFKVKLEDECKITKRQVLSTIARIFDPLGLLGPVITKAKIFLQRLWFLKLKWDDLLPEKEAKEWQRFFSELPHICNIEIKRCILVAEAIVIELHGFCDASELAYGAVVYCKSISQCGEVMIRLVTSKSRVSPIKRVSIPRLELCAAVLLAKLMTRVISALKLNINNVFLWSVSMIVLSWLQKEPCCMKTFVANRVAVVQEMTDVRQWRHVPSGENPADIISRGLDSSKLVQSELWWCGPPFLQQPVITECQDNILEETEELYLRELKTSAVSEICAFINTSEPLDVINNCSSYNKLLRIVAWCKRFSHNTRHPLHAKRGTLTTSELSSALLCIVKNVQRTSFVTEIQCLERGAPIPTSSKLLNLCPFLDHDGVLRVGGRLKNSNLSEMRKHPMVLPTKHNFTVIVINHFHVLYFHAGAETTLSLIRSKFWIVSARNVIRKIIFNCMICKKVNSRSAQQQMADLPAARVTVSRVFARTGIDFCGPFVIKNFVGRSRQVRKVFVCIFVCFTTKALHFEIVNDLTSAAFIAALKRFIARRGKPSDIFSDNGKNFVGAYRELRAILKSLFKDKSEDEIKIYLATEGINWHFNPPSTPHFGGLWEASVKSLKYHLKRVVGKTILTYEEFLTLIVQIESVLNSRPLCPISNDPNDVEALTPAHFLIGSSLIALPEPNFIEIPMNRLTRWQMVQKLNQNFWKKWSSEYLNKLLNRPKWYKGKRFSFSKGFR